MGRLVSKAARLWGAQILVGIVLGVAGRVVFELGVRLGELRWERCGDNPALSIDSSCHGAPPGYSLVYLGGTLFVAGVVLALTGAIVGAVRRLSSGAKRGSEKREGNSAG